MVRRRVLPVLLALVCGVAAGCGSSGDDADAAGSEAAAPLVADIQRSTLFDTRREFGLSLASTADADVQLETIQLVTPLFEPVAPTVRDATLAAGDRARVMPIPYGTAVCGEDVGDDGGADADIVLSAVVDGVEVRVPVTEHPGGMLAELHARECAATAVLEDVELALDGAWTVVDPSTATGQLTATQRTTGAEVAIDELLGNVIFGVTTANAASPVLAVDDAQPTASVGVTVSAARCDPHALTEYKRTFVFVVVVAVGDGEPVRVDVRAEGAAHDALGQLLTSCVA